MDRPIIHDLWTFVFSKLDWNRANSFVCVALYLVNMYLFLFLQGISSYRLFSTVWSSLFTVVIYYMNKFTRCFHVNSPRSIGCGEKVKEAKKKKTVDNFGWTKKRKERKLWEMFFFSTFVKVATPTASELQQKRRPWSATQSYWVGKVLTSSSLFTCTYIKKSESLLTI